MSSTSADFNYKVALASGLKSLRGGRLRQAEEQFRYLVRHFPSSDGGYRGLAKVLVEQEDRPAALRVLLDGGAALAKAGDRVTATALYREAVALDAHDLAAHRRLAAALALAGDGDAAAHEYVRYIRSAIELGDVARARLEAAYALERMPANAEIAGIASGIGVAATASGIGVAATASNGPTPPRANAGWGSAPRADAWAEPARAGEAPALEPIAADVDAQSVEATAAGYLAKGDPRGGQAALEAARRYIADGRVDAASDLLLQLIAAGIVDHEAQRLLVEVTKSLGRKDVAKAKVRLLVQALRLDGRTDLAAEVEQLARAD
ncbi:MAG TPA: hypothetical protein VFC31_04730 [Candidatus Limnocylindria bacterium]|nr:hypothetical protein [Candidatus Limnocylindria bacterium]